MIVNGPSFLVFTGASCFFGFSWLRHSFLSHPDASVWGEWLCWGYLAAIARILTVRRHGAVSGGNAEENGSAEAEPWNLKIYIYALSVLVARVSMQFTSYQWLLVGRNIPLRSFRSDTTSRWPLQSYSATNLFTGVCRKAHGHTPQLK